VRVRRLRASLGAERARSRQGLSHRDPWPERQRQSARAKPDASEGTQVSRASPPFACYFLIVSFRAFLIGAPSHRSLSSSSPCSSVRKALLRPTAVSKGKVRPKGFHFLTQA